MDQIKSFKNSVPAIILMLLAPLIAEVLPGATRFSSLFVFPIEVCVWGGGALLIRYIVRKHKLGWVNMLLLSLALSIAEEFLIQQTSVAPMVLQIKGIVYARAFGVNYVYLLWALIYETVFVVFLPVCLVELIFPARKEELWIGNRGLATVILLFFAGSFLAWFSWTQIARINVFHVLPYHPQLHLILLAVGLIGGLIYIAIGPHRKKIVWSLEPFSPPPYWMLAMMGCLWAMTLYGLVLLGFGILPAFPTFIPMIVGLLLVITAICFLPRWTANEAWSSEYSFSIISGTITGSMIAGFIGFIGAAPLDLYFKIIANAIAVICMFMLFNRIKKH